MSLKKRVVQFRLLVAALALPLLLVLPGPAGAFEELHVFVRGGDNGIYQSIGDGSQWSSWVSPLGGLTNASPAVVSYNGQLHLFVRGTDNALYQAFWDGSQWNDWIGLGGFLNAAPAVVSHNGQLHVFVVGGDDALYWMYWDGSQWNGWFALGGIIKGQPAAVSYNGQLYVYLRGSDDRVYFKRWDGSPSDLSLDDWWVFTTGSIISGPGAVVYDGQMYAFGVGLDNALWYLFGDGNQWFGWFPLGGIITGAPAATVYEGLGPPGELRVFVRGGDNGAWQAIYDGFDWGGWFGLGGITLAGPGATNYFTTAPGPGPGPGQNNPPTLGRVEVTRTTLSHGRLDDVRPTGVASVPGFTALFDAIAAMPNPLLVTLDDDGDGKPDLTNPIVVAGAGLPSCCTLAVAEEVADPDGDPVAVSWEFPGPRFGSGNFYATVSIPSEGIVAGMELVTFQELEAYTANTIIWEAPDVSFPIQDTLLDGGSEALAARAIDFPPAPSTSLMSDSQFKLVDYAITIQAEIVEVCKVQNPDGSFRIRLQVNISGNFDPLDKTWFRWAYEGSGVTIMEDIPASNQWEFEVPEGEAGTLAKITVVASSFGPLVVGNPNLFVVLPPPGSVGLTTFDSNGCTISDTETIIVESSVGQEICGDGIDNDCDDEIDENCDFKLFVEDNQCLDDTIGVIVDGQDLGITPLGQGRFFDISQFAPGQHTLIIVAVASGGAKFGCSPNPIVSYGVTLLGGVEFVGGGTTAGGEIDVGTQATFTIVIP